MNALAQEALDFAQASLRGALLHFTDAVMAEAAARRAVPHRWALVHGYLAEHTPRWRWLARLHHRRLARRYGALAWATDTLEVCSGGALAKALGLEGAAG